jgi:hypothetical protein
MDNVFHAQSVNMLSCDINCLLQKFRDFSICACHPDAGGHVYIRECDNKSFALFLGEVKFQLISPPIDFGPHGHMHFSRSRMFQIFQFFVSFPFGKSPVVRQVLSGVACIPMHHCKMHSRAL